MASPWWETEYPGRYYAAYDTAATQPTAVTGWIDVNIFSSKPDWLPAASALLPLTAAQWGARLPTGKGVLGNAIVDYTPPAVAIPLKTQATSAQTWIQQQANLAAAMGQTFTDDMRAYVLAIAAIANGTDTTSTALPAQPTDVMTASTAAVAAT